jgi:urease accessory protein
LKRATSIKRASEWDRSRAADCVVLDADDRNRRRIVLNSERGDRILLDLPKPETLRDGDGLILEDGSIVRVAGLPEALLEITAPTSLGLVRLAWHLGNRHTDVEIAGDRLRIRDDHVLKDMVTGLGATAVPLHAPFDPEAGAPQHHHEHDHGS